MYYCYCPQERCFCISSSPLCSIFPLLLKQYLLVESVNPASCSGPISRDFLSSILVFGISAGFSSHLQLPVDSGQVWKSWKTPDNQAPNRNQVLFSLLVFPPQHSCTNCLSVYKDLLFKVRSRISCKDFGPRFSRC